MLTSSAQPFVVTSGTTVEEAEAVDEEDEVDVPLVLEDEESDADVDVSLLLNDDDWDEPVVVPEVVEEPDKVEDTESEALVVACEADTDIEIEAVAWEDADCSEPAVSVAESDVVGSTDVAVGIVLVVGEVLEAPISSVATPGGAPVAGS